MLAVRGFEIGLSTTRDVYLDGESFPLQVVTTDAQGEPTGESLSAALVKQVTTQGRVTEREVERKPAHDRSQDRARIARPSGSTTRKGAATSSASPGPTGSAIRSSPIACSRSRARRTRPSSACWPTASAFKVGEEASVNLHSRDRAGTALAHLGGRPHPRYKLVTLKEGDNPVAWAIDGRQFPNFTLTSTRMWRRRVRRGQARYPGRARPARHGHAGQADGRPGRAGRARGHHRRPARPARLGRAIDRDGRPVALAALQRHAAADRPVLLQPDPHRRLRDRGDQHVSLRAGDGARLAGRGRGGRTRGRDRRE